MTAAIRDAPVRRIVALVLLGFVLVNGGYDLGRAAFGPKRGEDFAAYYIVGRDIRSGYAHDIYDPVDTVDRRARAYGVRGIAVPEGGQAEAGVAPTVKRDKVQLYVYPPPSALVFVPISFLPYRVAVPVFFLLSLLAEVAAIWLFFADHPRVSRRTATIIGIGAMVVFFPSTYGLYMGQINPLVFLTCIAGLWAMRRDRPVLAGALVAIATAAKLYPGILLVLFLVRRQFRALAAAIATGAALFLVSLPVVGWNVWHTYLTKVVPEHNKVNVWVRNQSISGFLGRLLIKNPYVKSLGDHPSAAHALGTALGLAVLLVVVVFVVRGRGPRLDTNLEWATFLATAVLILSTSWEHYAIFLLPAFFVVGEHVAARVRDGTRHVEVIAFLAAVAFSVWAFVLKTGAEYLALPKSLVANPIYSVKFFATVLLVGCCLAVLRSQAEPHHGVKATAVPPRNAA
ncbi:MAG: hypothetical protein JWO37_1302 [Acidimicrobiales bacterium]|nr:hypothetical protein [Acidimicrobiales bacterium]